MATSGAAQAPAWPSRTSALTGADDDVGEGAPDRDVTDERQEAVAGNKGVRYMGRGKVEVADLDYP
ncbi:MAG TPA: hypothetical protein VIG96_04605, partial [Blastococcus sp.]